MKEVAENLMRISYRHCYRHQSFFPQTVLMTGYAHIRDPDYTGELAGIGRFLVHGRNFAGGSIRMLRRRDACSWRDSTNAAKSRRIRAATPRDAICVSE
ncbi:hypothetical protein [Paraburkholderia terrae]|uniref:hypothetical protein n=1 Tax=Paraburkholderia terrae TaxID=311230 RepID=UPI0033659AFF